MPRTRKVSLAEMATLSYTDPKVRAELAAHYDALLMPFAAGDYSLAEPESGETRLAVRRRLSAAAARRGWILAFGQGFRRAKKVLQSGQAKAPWTKSLLADTVGTSSTTNQKGANHGAQTS